MKITNSIQASKGDWVRYEGDPTTFIVLQFFLATRHSDKYNDARFASGTLIIYDGPLAQLVEQLTLNQRVEGSTPSRLTRTTTGEQWVIGRNP
jgi:hypothetical protein